MHSNSKEAIRSRLDQLPDHILWTKVQIRHLPVRPRGWKPQYVGLARRWLAAIYAIKTCTSSPKVPKILVRDVVEGAKSHAHWKRKLQDYPDLQGPGDYTADIKLPESLDEYGRLHHIVSHSDTDFDFKPLECIEKAKRDVIARAKATGEKILPEYIQRRQQARDQARELRKNLGRFYVIPFLFQRPLSEVEINVLAAIEFELTRKPAKTVRVSKGMRRFGGRPGHGYRLFGHSQSWIEKCGLDVRESPGDEITKDERAAISLFLKAVARLERDFHLKLTAKQLDGTLLDLAGVKKLIGSTRGRKCDSGHKSLKTLAELVVWFEVPKDYLKIWREVFYKDRGLGLDD